MAAPATHPPTSPPAASCPSRPAGVGSREEIDFWEKGFWILELELNIKFPTCWDGVNTEALDGAAHVVYSPDCDPDNDNECFDHACPASHPRKGTFINKYLSNQIEVLQ